MKLARDTWLIYQRSLLQVLRNPVWLIFGLLQPILYLVCFGPLLHAVASAPGFPGGGSWNVFVPGLLLQIAVFSGGFVGFGLIAQLRYGVIERFRVTPMNRTAMLLGMALRDATVLVSQGLLLMAVAIPFGLTLDAADVAVAVAGLLLVGRDAVADLVCGGPQDAQRGRLRAVRQRGGAAAAPAVRRAAADVARPGLAARGRPVRPVAPRRQRAAGRLHGHRRRVDGDLRPRPVRGPGRAGPVGRAAGLQSGRRVGRRGVAGGRASPIGHTRSVSLISVGDLARRLDDPEHEVRLRVVDTRWYLLRPGDGRVAYDAGHIPGAIFLDLDTDLSAPPGPDHIGGLGRHPLPTPAAFAARMGEVGIGDDSFVVVYDDAGAGVAARLWWMLDALGHREVAVLDGGWQAWLAAGLPTTTEVPTYPPTTLTTRAAWPRTIERRDLAARLPSVLLLDGRATERYRGDVEPIDPAAGHIPTRHLRPDRRQPWAGRALPAADRAAAALPGPGGGGGAAVRPDTHGRDGLRQRHERVPDRARHAARRPARSAGLRGLVQRLVAGRSAGRDG